MEFTSPVRVENMLRLWTLYIFIKELFGFGFLVRRKSCYSNIGMSLLSFLDYPNCNGDILDTENPKDTLWASLMINEESSKRLRFEAIVLSGACRVFC